MIGDLRRGSETEVGRQERIGHVDADAPGDGGGSAATVLGHDDGLHERVQLDPAPAPVGRRAHPRDGVVEPRRFPADIVVLSVLSGPAEHRRRHNVGVPDCVGQRGPAVDADEEGDVLLQGRHGRGVVEAVVVPAVRDAIAVEQ